jgi:putative oligomerization/nucleic acid binding protein
VSQSKAAEKPEKGSRRRRAGVLALVVLGALCIFISTLGIWIRDVALDENEWANTSSQLLQSEDVRNVLSVYIVDQSYVASDAEARLEAALPEQLKPLAGPISAQLRGLAYEAVARALARPRVQELWRTANRAVNAQLVDLLEGNTERLQATNGTVVLNLDQIVADVSGAIGAGGGAAEALQGRIEPITILKSDQLSTAQKAVKWLKALSFWPFILGVALWAGAVYLAAGRRRPTLRNIAWSLVIIGLLILAIRRVVGNAVIDNLVATESVRPAARDVWTVLTSLLAQSAWAGILVGLVAVLAIWFSGSGSRATAGRRWLAPAFRDHPLIVHGTLAVLLLLFLAWGPVGTPRRSLAIVILVVLAFVGLEILRRQTVREFPDEVAHYDFHRRRRGAGGVPADERVESLERLAALHERGALTDEEYEAEKALLAT